MIQQNCSYILTMPSEQQRLVRFDSGNTTFVGKFGEFSDDEILGKPFGSFQLINNKIVKVNNIEESWFASTDPLDYHQKLQTLIQNNEGFEDKSEFAKDKYVQKHNKKTKNILRIGPLTSQALCEYYFKRGPMAILQLNWDLLSIMLFYGNITYNGKYLCFDSVRGILVHSVYNKLTQGKVYQVMQTDGEANELSTFENYDPHRYAKSTWSKLHQDSEIWIDNHAPSSNLELKKQKMETRIKIRNEILQGEFDCIFMATKYDELPILKKISSLIAGSGQIVIYSPYLEKLSKILQFLRSSEEFCNVDLFTTHFREYQILPHRTRPQMKHSSSGGGIVVATKLLIK